MDEATELQFLTQLGRMAVFNTALQHLIEQTPSPETTRTAIEESVRAVMRLFEHSTNPRHADMVLGMEDALEELLAVE